jgi:hypothetical protein
MVVVVCLLLEVALEVQQNDDVLSQVIVGLGRSRRSGEAGHCGGESGQVELVRSSK